MKVRVTVEDDDGQELYWFYLDQHVTSGQYIRAGFCVYDPASLPDA